MAVTVLIGRVLIGGLLVITGVLKVGHAPDLAASIAGFRLLPSAIIEPLALVIPFFEIIVGGYLLAGLFTRIAAYVACAQFLLYGGAIASAVLRHIPANCGCFGPHDVAVADWPHVAFDVILAACAAFIAFGAPGAISLDRRLTAS